MGLAPAGRLQLAARVLPGDDLPGRVPGPDRRLRRAPGLPRPDGPEVGHRHHPAAPAGYRRRVGVLAALGFFGAVWAGSGAMGSIVKAVNRAYGRVETRPIWKVRGISLVLLLASGNGARRDAAPDRPRRQARRRDRGRGRLRRRVHLALEPRPLAARVRRHPAPLRAHLLPGARTSSSAPGSGSRRARSSGAVLWLALSGLFALYTSFSDSYSRTYGALAGGIVLLLWLNYSAWAVLFGAELNAEVDRQAERRELRRLRRDGERALEAPVLVRAVGVLARLESERPGLLCLRRRRRSSCSRPGR